MKTNLTLRSSPRSLHCRIGFTVLLLLMALNGVAAPMGTAITYQGRLNFSGAPAADGLYDFLFTLYDAATFGSPVGSAVAVSAVPVTKGVFSVQLDFGATAFTTGDARWLQLEVNISGVTPLDPLAPRQRLTPAPQAIYADSAATASSAGNLTGTLPVSQLTGTILDARLSPNVALRGGGNAFTGNQTIAGSVVVDQANQNAGAVSSASLTFGLSSGEGIGSKRTSGGNQFGLDFYTASLNRMTILNNNGNVGIGTTQPGARLSLVAPGASELGGTARSATLLTSAGGLGTVAGNELALATIGFRSDNSSSLGIRALRVADGSGWFDTAIGLGMDVDNTIRAGASLWLHANGNVGIGATSPSTKLEVNGAVTATTFSGSGAGLTSLNAGNLTGTVPAAALGTVWKVGGNTGTAGGFLGTLDSQPMRFFAGNSQVLSLETKVVNLGPSQSITAVNVLGGPIINTVANGVIGATIGGGGSSDVDIFSITPHPNTVWDGFGTVGGGLDNTAGSADGNTANGRAATVAGGEGNHASGSHSFIGGGQNNTNSGAAATVSGGQGNSILPNASHSTIAGGTKNLIQSDVVSSTISGGSQNTIMTGGTFGTQITPGATIGGGGGNTIQGFLEAEFGFTSPYSTISGGCSNNIYNARFATLSGGYSNNIYAYSATIGGGYGNAAGNLFFSGSYATVPGGYFNYAAGNYSFAAGRQAKALHNGSFVWADSTAADFPSTADNQFSTRASGGYRLFSNNAGAAGVSLAPNGTAWGILSDRNVKKDFAPVDQRTILEKLAALPITQWHYEWESPDVTPHIGPMAQDFKAAFYPGTDDKTITTQEADGVALAAIQGLNQKLEEQRAENSELKQRLEKLEQLMNHKNGGVK